jgi:gliding motility-associated-like protein
MRKWLNRNLLLVWFSWMAVPAGATHIVGGELNYTYLGGDSYRVQLTLIRDCRNSATPFDAQASIGVYSSGNSFLFQVLVSPTDSSLIPNTANSPCLIPPTNICYRVAHYDTVISLPPRIGGYQLAYQRCCRNNSIANIANVASTGATYYATVPDRSVVPINSSPVFNNLPSTFLCRNELFDFDNSATDYDGDSLVYAMCVPFEGADPTAPQPQPPSNPPYNTIVWASPYSFANPLGGSPLAIDPVTGRLTAVPLFIGQFVYGVCVKEYRNGVYLGETRRDFQVNVVNCPRIVTAAILSPVFQCGNNLVQFTSTSSGASQYRWDFGIDSLDADTSLAQAPSYLYPDTGEYTVQLVAHAATNFNCTDTATRQVRLYPALVTDFAYSTPPCGDTAMFTDATSQNNGAVVSWLWDFGDGTTAGDSVVTHAYSVGGNYVVRLISSSQRGCVDTAVKTIGIPLIPLARFTALTDSCHPEVALVNQSARAARFTWDLGDGTVDHQASFTHIYREEGRYHITLTAESESNCLDTVSQELEYAQWEFLGHYLPNSFTPNGDGRNDVFVISGANSCEVAELIIFNRWGKQVFRTTDLSGYWDGTGPDGTPVEPGVYVYRLTGKTYDRMGTITLIR